MFLDVLFILSALTAVLGSMGVVFSKNVMHACIYLFVTLFGVAGLYATLGADFLAGTQVVVYAGGVVILMLFAIMLTGGNSDKVNKFGVRKILPMGDKKTFTMGFFAAVVVAMVLLKILAVVDTSFEQGNLPPFETSVEKIGTLLLTDHVLAFEISSVLLLGALVGAAVISRPKRINK